MNSTVVKKFCGYDKTIDCAPDKSVSVRAVVICGFARGESIVRGISTCDDVLSAVECMRRLGSRIEIDGDTAYITGVGGTPKRDVILDCGNSGTTAKLLMGLLAGVDGRFTLVGDASLSGRRFDRARNMLADMGAKIDCDRLPTTVCGGGLSGVRLEAEVPSAQDKSAVLLAGISADGTTEYRENVRTRDHTEIMLERVGADITRSGETITVRKSTLHGAEIIVPGDISSATYPICIALAVAGGRCTVKNVGINPTRRDVLDVLIRSGGDITFTAPRGDAEKVCDITAKHCVLSPMEMSESECARAIDEVPTLAALACLANGVSVFRGADKLRGKETDRVETTIETIRALGGEASYNSGVLTVVGGRKLHYGKVDCRGDHRIAMTAAVLGCCGEGCEITGCECVSISYPRFFEEVIGV